MLSMFEHEYGLHIMECVLTKRQWGGGGLKTELGGSSDAGYV